MRYTGLDRTARYRLRVVMPGETSTPARRIALRLVADGSFEIHPYMEKPVPFRPLELTFRPKPPRTESWSCEHSAAVRKSETVALRHPIMPVGYGFGGRVVRVNGGQLG